MCDHLVTPVRQVKIECNLIGLMTASLVLPR